AWTNQEEPQRPPQGQRDDLLAPAGTPGSRGGEKEGDVAAQFRREGGQFRSGQAQPPQLVQSLQGGGRIGRAACESGGQRDALGEGDGRTSRRAGALPQ